MTPASISIVIPARNDATALACCLAALERQRVTPFEIIVVDNASQDATMQVARRYGARVVSEDRVGIPQAAAAGYDAARGDIIARLDADSIPPATWVGQVVAALADPERDAVTGLGYFHDVTRAGGAAAWLYLGAYYLLCFAALGHHALWGSNMALRRSAWQEARSQVHDDDAEVHDDLDLAFALGPGRRIYLERALRVGASARGLMGMEPLRRRFVRAGRTLSVNWAVLAPWERWAQRLRRRGIRGRGR